MKLPLSLHQEIISFLTTLPTLYDSESQRALILSAGLDPELINQIPIGKPPLQFVPVLISTLTQYGELADGRYALEAVLEKVKDYVGQEKRNYCGLLIQQLRDFNEHSGGSFVPMPNEPVDGCNLPNRHPNFVGRHEEIKRVINALASRAWIVTIDGIGGIGKTSLALEVAHLCKERNIDYPSSTKFTGHIWMSARDKLSFCLDDAINEILKVVNVSAFTRKDLDPTERLNLAIRALSDTQRPYLLIIDNFETVKDEPLHKFLRDQLPNPSKAIITSRHHIQTGEIIVTISGLEESEALKLLYFEADRLQIPIDVQSTSMLRLIAEKSFGIPFVLRWVMESVFNGKTLDWVLESLENATATDIFEYIFDRSISMLDPKTHDVFRSMALFPTWTTIDTIVAINPDIKAIKERISHLVSLSLVDDNRNLVTENRRYQLPALARHLAYKEFLELKVKGRSIVEHALKHYMSKMIEFTPSSQILVIFLQREFDNIRTIIETALKFSDESFTKECINLINIISDIDYRKALALFDLINAAKLLPQSVELERLAEKLDKLRKTVPSLHPCPNATFSDLDWDLIEAYADRIAPEFFQISSKEETLSNLKLYSPIFYDKIHVPHKSAVLCFGNRPDGFFPQAKAIFLVGQPGDSVFIRTEIYGPLPKQFSEMMKLIKQHTDTKPFIDPDGLRKEISEVDFHVIRELVSNAITHRDYELNGSVTVMITPEIIEIRSPGTFPLGISWSSLIKTNQSVSSPVNSIIFYYLSNLLIGEGIGRGFTIFRAHIDIHGEDSLECIEAPGPTTIVRIRKNVE